MPSLSGGGNPAVAATFDIALNDIIGAIYDATIEPDGWPDALDAILSRFSFQMAILGIARADASMVAEVGCNVPSQYLALVPAYTGEIARAWGGLVGMSRLPLEEPLLYSDLPSFPERHSNRYYVEWARPQGLVDQCVFSLISDDSISASLGLGIHERRGPLSDHEMDELRLLGPHLRRAAIISGIVDRSATAAETFGAALDVISAGAVLVGPRLEIVHANQPAEKMLLDGDPIRAASGRLELVNEILRGGLVSAVSMANNEAELGRRGIGIPALRRDGSPVAVHVMPLDRRASRRGIASTAVAAVFVAENASRIAAPTDTAMLLYSLTPAEARVFDLVVSGRSSEQMSAELGIRASTLRTHLLRVFDKTGRHSRSDLVRLASEIKLPL